MDFSRNRIFTRNDHFQYPVTSLLKKIWYRKCYPLSDCCNFVVNHEHSTFNQVFICINHWKHNSSFVVTPVIQNHSKRWFNTPIVSPLSQCALYGIANMQCTLGINTRQWKSCLNSTLDLLGLCTSDCTWKPWQSRTTTNAQYTLYKTFKKFVLFCVDY